MFAVNISAFKKHLPFVISLVSTPSFQRQKNKCHLVNNEAVQNTYKLAARTLAEVIVFFILQLRNSRCQKGVSTLFNINAIGIYYIFFQTRIIFQIIKISGSAIPQICYEVC